MEQLGDTFLSIAQVEARVSLKKSEIYSRIRAGKFPKQVPLGDGDEGFGRVGWSEREINQWIEARIAARDHGAEARRKHAKEAFSKRNKNKAAYGPIPHPATTARGSVIGRSAVRLQRSDCAVRLGN